MSGFGLVLGGCAAIAVVGAMPPPRIRPRSELGAAVPVDRPTERRSSATAALGVTTRELLAVVGVALVAGMLLPPLGLAVLALPVARRWRTRRRHRRVAARALSAALPEAVDLLLLCGGAGLPLPLALPLVAERAPEPVGTALRAVELAAEGGSARSDALLAHLAVLGDQAAGVAHVLVDHLRYGSPLDAGLERVAFELRLARRRLAEEEARRLPVRLLAPLLLCVLPAFVLLTVVPLLVAALQSLPRTP